jgi:hypothetical protein
MISLGSQTLAFSPVVGKTGLFHQALRFHWKSNSKAGGEHLSAAENGHW